MLKLIHRWLENYCSWWAYDDFCEKKGNISRFFFRRVSRIEWRLRHRLYPLPKLKLFPYQEEVIKRALRSKDK